MSIEHCPRCSARVRVPAAAEPESWVRCPRCKMESQLSDMLAAEPPELELIDGPSSAVPDYTPALAGAGAAGEDFNEFAVASSDTLVVDEDSPTLPLGGVSFGDNFLDEDSDSQGAIIGRGHAAKSEDDDLFGFDDNPDVEALRTTSEDGKYIDVPAEGDGEFNLTPDESADTGAAISPAALGTGLKGIPTGVPRRKKKSGIVPMMIGVVGGGVFGILIAYFGILMWALEKDPFHVANMLPESMQMLVPDKLKAQKPVASNNPPANPENNSGDNTTPENMDPMNEGSPPSTENGSGDMNVVPAPPSTDPSTPMPETPAVDPMTPLVPPENTEVPKPATNVPDAFGNDAPLKPADIPGVETPITPAPNPTDVFGNDAPIKPEMLVKPEVAVPLTPDPVDPLTPKPVDPPVAPTQPNGPLMLAGASFAPEELAKSLTDLEAASAALAAPPEDPKELAKLQAGVYKALGHIGEVAGQLKSIGETPEAAKANQETLQKLSQKISSDPNTPKLTNLTRFWLTMPLEKRNNGIVLQGIPGTTEPAGKYHRTNLDVPGTADQKLTVVSEHPLVPNADGKVTVLGVIVEKPMEQIPGYPGPAERVIWVSVGEMEKPAAAPAGDAGTPPAPAPLPEPAKKPLDDPFGE